jgi:uncharacterized damage-inducible protein DinB
MTARDVRQLFAYNKWANLRVFASLSDLSDEQFTRGLGSSFSSIRDTVAHVGAAEWAWLQRWLGTSPTAIPDWAKGAARTELQARFEEIDAARTAYLDPLSDADIDRTITYAALDGTRYTQPLGPQFQHVVNHSTYHRGQIATMLRQLGFKPTGTDLITYTRLEA